MTVVFNESMDTATLPTLVYGNPAVTGGHNAHAVQSVVHLVHDGGGQRYGTVTYDVADRDLAAPNITIDVTGAKDAAGNLMQNYTPEAEFSIDTRNPSVNVVHSARQRRCGSPRIRTW